MQTYVLLSADSGCTMLCAIYGLALLVALDYFGLHMLWIAVCGLAVRYMLHFWD